MHALAPLLLSAALGAAQDGPVLLEYRGNLVSELRNEEPVGVKRFTLTCVVRPAAEGHEVFFVVQEQGGGEWPWPERFGRLVVADGEVKGDVRPRLLHTFNDTKYPVDLPLPIFPDSAKLAAGEEWVRGKDAFEVAGRLKIGDRETDRIDVSTNFGLYLSMWIEDDSLLVKADRKLFLGRGDRFRLLMELSDAKPLVGDTLMASAGVEKDLLAIQETLARDANETKPEIGEKSLAAIEATVAGLEAKADGTWLADFTKSIAKDAAAQAKRSADVVGLAEKFVGKPAPELELTGLDGKPIDVDEGKPLLLHFWDYRHENLEEPYGQVGYIGFLQGKREKIGLQIVGVAVDKGLAEAGKSSGVKRSIRKLQEFMRIRYPIALDDGELLAKFGDPRRLGAKLPLWVLIDHEGNVQTYHAGFYEADPRKGLVALDEQVVAALRKLHGRDE